MLIVVVFVLIFPMVIVSAEEEVEIDILIEFNYFRSVEELRARSSAIVHLEILDERVEWVNPWDGFEGEKPYNWRERYEIFTTHTARIIEVFQGDINVGEIIEIRQIGGSLDGTILRNPSMVNFLYGDNVLLFLSGSNSPRYGIAQPYQGAYLVNNDGSLSSYHNHLSDDLGLTWEILNQIQHDNGIEPNRTNEAESNYPEEYNDRETSPNPTIIESNSVKKIGIIVTGTILATILIILMMRRRNRDKAKDKN